MGYRQPTKKLEELVGLVDDSSNDKKVVIERRILGIRTASKALRLATLGTVGTFGVLGGRT